MRDDQPTSEAEVHVVYRMGMDALAAKTQAMGLAEPSLSDEMLKRVFAIAGEP